MWEIKLNIEINPKKEPSQSQEHPQSAKQPPGFSGGMPTDFRWMEMQIEAGLQVRVHIRIRENGCLEDCQPRLIKEPYFSRFVALLKGILSFNI